MIADLCLINPPAPWLVVPDSQAVLSLLYVAAAARQHGAKVLIYNMARRGGTIEEQMYPEADHYGITGVYNQVGVVNKIAKQLKVKAPSSKVIVGGPVRLSISDLDLDYIDTVVSGDGELAIQQLLNGYDKSLLCSSPVDINDVPTPARDLWDGPLGGPTFINGNTYFSGGSCAIISSRGCPNACYFCANEELSGRKVRFRNPSAVIEEMEQVVTDFGIREFTFWDEYFNLNLAHVEAICEAISHSKVLGYGHKIAWRVTVGATPSSPGLWVSLYNSGCREVSIGVESGDSIVLRDLGKSTTVEDNEKCLQDASLNGLSTRVLMMIGTPAQRPETLKKDISFLCKNETYISKVTAQIFVPVPGCQLSKHPERYGCSIRYDVEDWTMVAYRPSGLAVAEPLVDTEHMSRDMLRRHMQLFLDFLDDTNGLHHG